jgi:uncharacterized protein YgiM (DUF1202 family)
MNTLKLISLLVLLSLSCSLTTLPAVPDAEAKTVNNVYLTTPNADPSPIPSTMPSSCMVTAQSLHMRSCGSTDCTVIAWLSEGDVLLLQEKSQDWVRVTTPTGQTGWVHSKYCGGMP